MSIPTESDCLCTHDPVCPYCGTEQSDFWEISGEDGVYECGECERTFMWSRYVEVTYSTKPIVGPHRISERQQSLEAEEER